MVGVKISINECGDRRVGLGEREVKRSESVKKRCNIGRDICGGGHCRARDGG